MRSAPGGFDVVRGESFADRIADAVAGCPAVASLAAGPVATYMPGRRVAGVAIHDTDVQIAVVARYGPPLTEVAAQVRAAVAPLLPGLRIDVHIDDIRFDGPRPSRTAVRTGADVDAAGNGGAGAG
jgi:hypothetical protein